MRASGEAYITRVNNLLANNFREQKEIRADVER